MEQIAGASRSGPGLVLVLTGIFAALPLALAAIGIYGVIAYSVAQRVHEFGLRIALGARNHDLFAMVLNAGAAVGRDRRGDRAAVIVGPGAICREFVVRGESLSPRRAPCWQRLQRARIPDNVDRLMPPNSPP